MKILIGYYCGLALLVLGTLMAGLAHCSDKPPVYQDNPYTYKMGSVTSVAYVDGGLVVRLQPTATYTIFTEDILFCGERPLDLFIGKRNPVVLTYETRAHKTVQGIGCHELKRVDEMKGQGE